MGMGMEQRRQEFHSIRRNRPGQAAGPLGCEKDQVRDEMR